MSSRTRRTWPSAASRISCVVRVAASRGVLRATASQGACRSSALRSTLWLARGRHVVEEDVLALLDSGQLAGATLDVFRTEPLPPAHPFWRHPRVTVTPHIAGRTMLPETIAQIAGKVRALEAGLPIEGLVDRSRGY